MTEPTKREKALALAQARAGKKSTPTKKKTGPSRKHTVSLTGEEADRLTSLQDELTARALELNPDRPAYRVTVAELVRAVLIEADKDQDLKERLARLSADTERGAFRHRGKGEG